MPVQTLRFDGQDHAFFEHDIAVLAQHRLLLVKPWSHPVSNQRCRVVDALLFELRLGEFVYFACGHPGPASVNGLAMDFKRQLVAARLLGARLPENGEP